MVRLRTSPSAREHTGAGVLFCAVLRDVRRERRAPPLRTPGRCPAVVVWRVLVFQPSPWRPRHTGSGLGGAGGASPVAMQARRHNSRPSICTRWSPSHRQARGSVDRFVSPNAAKAADATLSDLSSYRPRSATATSQRGSRSDGRANRATADRGPSEQARLTRAGRWTTSTSLTASRTGAS
jgi:hypothetical protein